MIRDTVTPLMIVLFSNTVGLQVLPILATNIVLLVFIVLLRPITSRAVLAEELIGFVIYTGVLVLLLIMHVFSDSFSESTKYYFFGNLTILLILLQFGIFIVFCIANGLLSIKGLLSNYKIDVDVDEKDGAEQLPSTFRTSLNDKEDGGKVF